MSIRPCTLASLQLARLRHELRLALRCERLARHVALLRNLKRASDEDRDRVPDQRDNCRTAANPEQRDFDGDGIGDYCDRDDDNDGTRDSLDPAPLNPSISASAYQATSTPDPAAGSTWIA